MPLPPATVPLARKLLQWTGVRLEVPACHEWANYCAFSFIQKATMVYVNTCAHGILGPVLHCHFPGSEIS